MRTGGYLREKRRAKGLTLEEVASMVGVTKTTVAKWETGRIKSPRADKILAIATAYDADPLDVMRAFIGF